jgi:PadR family transcriptional regulator, regulatory protein PadR
VEEGSLYPALHRMEQNGWIASEWALTETKRKAKYYKLTNAGKRQLQEAERNFEHREKPCAICRAGPWKMARAAAPR